jgi:hypothetical protein
MHISTKLLIGLPLPFIFLITVAASSPLTVGVQSRIDMAISQLHSKEEKNTARSWDNAKKVSEFICRPIALTGVKIKQFPQADKVFLGDTNPDSLNLTGNYRLSGTGEAHTDDGWHDFTFHCDIDPTNGVVTEFNALPLSWITTDGDMPPLS